MPEYGEILNFLAKNPPQFASERAVHASMLELMASCLRNPEAALESPMRMAERETGDIATKIAESHFNCVHFS